MSDRGLTHRLSQRSRRAGLMIGISMVVTVAFCAVAFTVIYTALEGFTSDFVSSADSSAPSNDPEDANVAEDLAEVPSFSGLDLGDSDEAAENTGEASPNSAGSVPTPTPAPDPEDDEAEGDGEDNGDEGAFDPDFQIRNGSSINLREGPGTDTSILTTLPAATPLEYLGEEAPTDSAQDGDRWMRFRTEPADGDEDGLEGWIREIDTAEFEP